MDQETQRTLVRSSSKFEVCLPMAPSLFWEFALATRYWQLRRALTPISFYGHRGVENQPVGQVLLTRRCYITSQNHGFAVRDEFFANGVGTLVHKYKRRNQRRNSFAREAPRQHSVPPRGTPRAHGHSVSVYVFSDWWANETELRDDFVVFSPENLKSPYRQTAEPTHLHVWRIPSTETSPRASPGLGGPTDRSGWRI